MKIKKLNFDFSICKVKDYSKINLDSQYYFIGKTDEENSLVCITQDIPENIIEHDDNWNGFRIQDTLNLSLIGILSQISSLLAKNRIGLFTVSTFNTDYIFTKKQNFLKALNVLSKAGYEVD